MKPEHLTITVVLPSQLAAKNLEVDAVYLRTSDNNYMFKDTAVITDYYDRLIDNLEGMFAAEDNAGMLIYNGSEYSKYRSNVKRLLREGIENE